jgi:hypothetical protein
MSSPENTLQHRGGHRRGLWVWWIVGAASLLWLLLRSGTDPKRLSYPCQQAATANSVAFLTHLVAILGLTRLAQLLRRKTTFAIALTVLVGGILLAKSIPPTSASAGLDLTLQTWSSASAVSNVFVVSDVPIPECSLAGGTLPATPPCDDLDYALHDRGVDQLIDAMEGRGDFFYETTAHPTGIVGADDVVVIKINNQWGGLGRDNGVGRLATNTDVLKGLIWQILQHPNGFTGEVVVAENTQRSDRPWDLTPANAQDQEQSFQDVVDVFVALDYSVSLSDWATVDDTRISGGSVGDVGYPIGEYASGNSNDAYIMLEDPAATGTEELSYPKFETANGNQVSMRYGIWDGDSYHEDQLTFINLPVLKAHGMAGATSAWKNLIGFVTVRGSSGRFGDWDMMHDFFWGYTGGDNAGYGLIGRQMALIRTPALNIIDAIWVAEANSSGNATRQDVLLASTDPYAVDLYASEYVLLPSWPSLGQDVSAARSGTFRSATRTNQNSAAAVWPGDEYPYIDLLDGYDGDAPSEDEMSQINVYKAPEPSAQLLTTAALATLAMLARLARQRNGLPAG